MQFHVYVQQDGSTPEYRGEFDTREQALAYIADMGGEMGEPLSLPGNCHDDPDVEAYNLGTEVQCPIAYIEVD